MTMSFRSIVRNLVAIRGRKSRKVGRKSVHSRNIGRTAHIAPVTCPSPSALVQQSPWANLPAELLLDILQRVEASETLWPSRKSIAACAAVCRSWREGIKEVVRTPEECGLLTFPMSLKQPGPRDSPIQCFIRRERATSTYSLYLGLSPALSVEASKLLLVAKKIRRATKTDFLISLVADDFSQAGDAYLGKLRSNFIGTKFVIYDRQAPCNSPIQSKKSKYRKLCPNQISSRVTVGEYNVATISYELNVLRTRGPRRMLCTMMSIPISSIQQGGTAPTPATFSLPDSEGNDKKCTSYLTHSLETTMPLVLKNKAPRWHEQLQCWCLNFKGRVTVASVKNFQLVAAVDSSLDVPTAEQEKVILQFGKIGKDIFTMDYGYPLSAFQAFAICLSSFDTKPACE